MIKNLLQKRWVLILLGFSVLALIITFILRLITPQQPVAPKTNFVTTDATGKSVSFANITFTGTPPTVPTTLPFASIQPSQTTLDYVKDQLIKTYALQQVTGVESLWQGDAYTLSYDSYADDFLFYAKLIPEDAPLTEPNKAIDQAQAFVQKTFPNLALVPDRANVIYFQGLEELESTTVDKAVAVEVPFTYTVENIPVYLGHERTAPIAVIINNQYTVQKVVFQPNFVTFVPSTQKATIIPLNTALENINTKSQASVVSAFESTTGVFTLDQVTAGILTSVQLEYRADLNSGLAYPFYRFSGKLTNQDGQTIQAEIITPAVAVQE